MKVLLTEKTARLAIEALEYKAHMEAGQSQEPYLIRKEDTEEWEAARKFKDALRMGKHRDRISKRAKQAAMTNKQGS